MENLRAILQVWDVDLWARGEADMSLLDPDVIFEDAILPDHVGETYRGHEGVARATSEWIAPYEEYAIELEQIVDAGESVVSIHRGRVKARHTGIEFEAVYAYVWRFRNGKVIYYQAFLDVQDALKAVGLAG